MRKKTSFCLHGNELNNLENENTGNNCDDITSNLSSDPLECENQLYNRILSISQRIKEKHGDPTIWEGKTYIKLMNLLKQGQKLDDQSVWNAVILILALLQTRDEDIFPLGVDVKNLEPLELCNLRKRLGEVFSIDENLKN